MRCSVVFGVTLRLLVINISSSSPAINTAAYYQRCVTTCETLAVVHRRLCWQHWPVVALTAGTKARYRLRIAISAYPTCIRRPVRGIPSEYCYAVWRGITRMAWLTDGKRMLMTCLFVLTQLTNVIDRQTDRHTHTAWRHRPRLCIASRGKKLSAWISVTVQRRK